jgi:hypothetical protein
MKKITIIGRGTAGCLAVAFFAKGTDWEIDWIYDPNIKQQSVGEGTTLAVPLRLYEDLDFGAVELESVYGTPKLGIRKMNWGKKTKDFSHTFPGGFHGYHFNAVVLQDYIIERMKSNKRVTFKNINVSSHDDLDTDFIMDCSGKPNDLSGYNIRNEIPVNAVSVTQCYWEGAKFNQTLTIARPYGWVFGIPLLNRCSIGYMYNKDINTLEEIEEDKKNIFADFNLNPSLDGNKFYFGNYTKKVNFTDRVVFNGNSSFFLEPLEATSMNFMITINNLAIQLFFKKIQAKEANLKYQQEIDNIANVIMLHYLAGSRFETKFWNEAYNKAETYLSLSKTNQPFKRMLHGCFETGAKRKLLFSELGEIGTWPSRSYSLNLENLGITEKLYNLLHN